MEHTKCPVTALFVNFRSSKATVATRMIDVLYPEGAYRALTVLFMTLFLLFLRFLPLCNIAEVKVTSEHGDPHHPLGGAKGGHH